MFLRFGESLLAMWLKVRTTQKIIYIAFLSIDFLAIAIGFAAIYTIKSSAMLPRASSLNKLASLLSQPIIPSFNFSVLKIAKHSSYNKVTSILIYSKPI